MKISSYYALSHQGLVRQNNEDSFSIVDNVAGQGLCFIIADGMGGHNKGELASQIASQYIARRIQLDLNVQHSPKKMSEILAEMVEKANVKVYVESLASTANTGMGTTLTVALFYGELLILAHVGDCRMYCLHKNQLQLLTKDHTLSQELPEEEQNKMYPMQNMNRHILTRTLGVPAYIHADAYIYKISRGDKFLLCTDGLYGYLPEREIQKILSDNSNPQEAAEDLIEATNASGGGDNITVMLGFVGT